MMTAIEAWKSLEKGNRIKHSLWEDGQFIELRDNELIDWDGVVWGFAFLFATNCWELYIEPPKPMTFMEAVQAMKEGKKVRRRNDWVDGAYIEMEEAYTEDVFNLFDIEATDWEVVE